MENDSFVELGTLGELRDSLKGTGIRLESYLAGGEQQLVLRVNKMARAALNGTNIEGVQMEVDAVTGMVKVRTDIADVIRRVMAES